ncbi:type VII secretion target [Mycobacterium sp. 050134]|uniref:type VII secretion target n=1 Tax=Mycobacterium sp. 050134 TaxID=3096111 RepID=UPI002ED90530
MIDLTVDPRYLKELAQYQDQAAVHSSSGATAAEETATNLWVTHGVISGLSNTAAGRCVNVRRAAGVAMADVSARLATALRIAGRLYANVEEDSKDTVDAVLFDQSNVLRVAEIRSASDG